MQVSAIAVAATRWHKLIQCKESLFTKGLLTEGMEGECMDTHHIQAQTGEQKKERHLGPSKSHIQWHSWREAMTYNCMTQPALGYLQGEAKRINTQPHSDLPQLSMGLTQPESRPLGALLMVHSVQPSRAGNKVEKGRRWTLWG